MEEKDFSERIDFPGNNTIQKDIMQNVNETYEELVQDVRRILKENNDASKLE